MPGIVDASSFRRARGRSKVHHATASIEKGMISNASRLENIRMFIINSFGREIHAT